MAIIAGIAGSFLGGLLASLIAGDGLKLRPSGFIGSIAGAVITPALGRYSRTRSPPAPVQKGAAHAASVRKKQQRGASPTRQRAPATWPRRAAPPSSTRRSPGSPGTTGPSR